QPYHTQKRLLCLRDFREWPFRQQLIVHQQIQFTNSHCQRRLKLVRRVLYKSLLLLKDLLILFYHLHDMFIKIVKFFHLTLYRYKAFTVTKTIISQPIKNQFKRPECFGQSEIINENNTYRNHDVQYCERERQVNQKIVLLNRRRPYFQLIGLSLFCIKTCTKNPVRFILFIVRHIHLLIVKIVFVNILIGSTRNYTKLIDAKD